MSSATHTRLPKAVAAASARAADSASTIAASARPKLSECPTVPDDVHTPSGRPSREIRTPTFPDRGEVPA